MASPRCCVCISSLLIFLLDYLHLALGARNGMTVRNFHGFPRLKEVECSGGSLKAEVDLLSLKLFRTDDNVVLASLSTFKEQCKTFSEYSSCTLELGNTRKSSVRTLLSDLRQGETVVIGCNATTYIENGNAPKYSWSIAVHRERLTVRDFLGFPSLKEVECSGGAVRVDVDLLYITLFKRSDDSFIGVLNTHKNTCKTFHEYASCVVDTNDPRKSVVKTLVADLEEGETIVLGCNVTAFNDMGPAPKYSWFLPVHRERMTVRDFLGFPSLQEVECSGNGIPAEVDLLSLTLFKTRDGTVLAILNSYKDTCKTFGEFSSCDLRQGDSRKSVVRTLVADLEEGETRVLGCNVTTFQEIGHAPRYSWSVPVYRKRMVVRDFLGFPSLQEVECSGRQIRTEMDVLSLTLFKPSGDVVLANAKTFKNTCKTYGEYSSCVLSPGNSKMSAVRTLVADLTEGGSVTVGCNVTAVQENGHPRVYSWSIVVRRKSES